MTQVEITDVDREMLEAMDDALGFLMDNERAIVLEALAAHRQAADRAGYDRGVRESAGVVSHMATHTFEHDDAYCKLATASENILALISTTGGEDPDTIGSHAGNGGAFDPEAKASQPLKDAVRIYRESQKLETVEAPPKASSQD